ncbi:MAG: hypothetical protein C0412_19495 [Flavobacterium sp.]|nr:hypothetical protein [Flavobacterium sp.]
MKKTAQFLICCLIFFNVSFAQCSISDLVPFNLGDDKFKTTVILNKLNTINSEKEYFSNIQAKWEKYPYLKNDSIYRVIITKEFYPTSCFVGSENSCKLYFADDKLYRITMYQDFKADEYEKMQEKYNSILDILSNIYPYSGSFSASNVETKEKISEGFRFSDVPKDKIPKIKIKEINVSYSIKYKTIWNNYSNKYDKTSDIDYFEMQIEFTNLAGTKLTSQSY